MLTVCIPSKTEKFLQRTILDVLEKASGEIEILPILDGYTLPDEEIVCDPRVRYIHLPPTFYSKKRHGINQAVSEARGEYIMSLDAHCMMAPGFDEQLIKDHQPNWVQIPRRHRLDANNWCLQTQVDNRPPIDYEYFIFPQLKNEHALHGFKWDQRTLNRWEIPIDDTLEFQGSCWFMTKEWFNQMGFMQIEGYTGWGQEAEEISLTTWKNGGRVVTNKNTWYAHLHKGPTHGRMYHLSRDENRKSYAFSYNKWLVEEKEFFRSLIKKFPPMPGWPENWEQILWPTETPPAPIQPLGYEETIKYFTEKFSLDLNQPSPFELPISRIKEIPEIFCDLNLKTGVEVGVYRGEYSEVLLKGIPGLKLHGVDVWDIYSGYRDYKRDDLKAAYEEAVKRTTGFDCTLIKHWSDRAFYHFPENSLDFVYIDGNHGFEHVVRDIAVWSTRVRPGGIIFGHDFEDWSHNWRRFDMNVINAVVGWCKSYQIHPWFIIKNDKHPGWMYIKK